MLKILPNIDILLIGDSITQYIGESPIDNKQFIKPWKQKFGSLVTVNAGIGGDRTENVLWRLEHGLLDNISPEYIVLMVGTNNAPLVAANGVPAKNVAWGIKLCVDNIRKKCPETKIILSKVLPAFTPGKEVYKSIENINNSLDLLNIDKDPEIIIIDLWKEFTESNGSLIKELYSDGHLHISEKGYEVYLDKLKLALKAQPK